MEIDIYGERREGLLADKEFLLVECKDKGKVSATDVMRFFRKLTAFREGLPMDLLGNKPRVTAVIALTGEVVADAKVAVKGMRPTVQFKRF